MTRLISRLISAYAEPFSETHRTVAAFMAGLALGLLIAGGGAVY